MPLRCWSELLERLFVGEYGLVRICASRTMEKVESLKELTNSQLFPKCGPACWGLMEHNSIPRGVILAVHLRREQTN
jgi:hypothetical protein